MRLSNTRREGASAALDSPGGRLRAQAPGAIEEVLELYGPELLGLAQLLLGNRQDAEDVLIDTVTTAWLRAHQLRDTTALRPWLFRILTNHSFALKRRLARRLGARSLEFAEISGSDMIGVTDRMDLLAAIRQLPEQMQAALLLRYYADLTVDEIAEALGKSPNTVKNQLRAAHVRLRHQLLEGARPSPQERHYGSRD